jgi:hypothetical protein
VAQVRQVDKVVGPRTEARRAVNATLDYMQSDTGKHQSHSPRHTGLTAIQYAALTESRPWPRIEKRVVALTPN